jgi:hypothetical protein
MSIKRTLAGETIGAMVVDPGGTTGLLWGVFKLEGENTYAMVRDGIHKRMEVRYRDMDDWRENEISAAEHIAQQWLELTFYWTVECGIPKEHQFLVIEDFILDPVNSARFTKDRSMLSPVRITCHIQGMLYQYDPQYVFQMPSMAQQITSERLKRHDLWYVGSEHCRLVTKHAVTLVRGLLS